MAKQHEAVIAQMLELVKAKMKTATLGFDEVLPVGKGVLEIKFRGILNDQMAGFYRSQYTEPRLCLDVNGLSALD